jgi:hypothetical protein
MGYFGILLSVYGKSVDSDLTFAAEWFETCACDVAKSGIDFLAIH